MSRRPIQGPERLASRGQAIWPALACAAILAAGIAAWSNSFDGPFIFDDLLAIQSNSTLRHFPAWENFAPPQGIPISRRPIVNLTLAINHAISGPGVRGFHAGNLLIHLLAALTLFGIVRRTLLTGRLTMDDGRPAAGRAIVHGLSSIVAVAVAFAVALIWAVHPLLTESVTYLTQRTELLMGLFFLLTLYGAIRGASSGHPWRWYAAAIAACALGMGSKEVMATAPIVVLLYDRCFLSGTFREAFRRRLPFYLGLAATWAILGALLIAYPTGETTGAGFGLAEAGPWEYARTQPSVILNYLRLSFWPSPLCLDYGWPIATSAWRIIPAAAVIAALLGGTLWALRRAPALGFLGAAFFLILAPSSSFVPIPLEIAAERRMYLPLAAIVTACVMAAYWLGNRWVRRATASPGTQKLLGRAAATAAVLSVAGVLGWLTFDRNSDYRNAITIWQDTVTKRPGNARAWNNFGYVYYQKGQIAPALLYFKKAIELKPDYAEAYNNRGVARTSAGQYSEALGDFKKAIELKPDDAITRCNQGIAHFLLDQFVEATLDFDKAIALQPGFAYAYLNRASVRYQMKEYDRALSDLKAFQRLGGQPPPDFVEALRQAAGRSK